MLKPNLNNCYNMVEQTNLIIKNIIIKKEGE